MSKNSDERTMNNMCWARKKVDNKAVFLAECFTDEGAFSRKRGYVKTKDGSSIPKGDLKFWDVCEAQRLRKGIHREVAVESKTA